MMAKAVVYLDICQLNDQEGLRDILRTRTEAGILQVG
jgi:hypothetical protein